LPKRTTIYKILVFALDFSIIVTFIKKLYKYFVLLTNVIGDYKE
jgi:hypothetical protein